MKFKKKLNNNVAFAEDKKGKEWIVVGKGIGFGKKENDEIEIDNINERYLSYSGKNGLKSQDSNMDLELLEHVENIVQLAEVELETTFTEKEYIALFVYLNAAVTRSKSKKIFGKQGIWKTKQLFPKEFAFSEKILKILEENLEVTFSESEAVFLTYYFTPIGDKEKSFEKLKVINQLQTKVLEIILEGLNIKLNDEIKINIAYERFIDDLNYIILLRLNNEIDALIDIDKDVYTILVEENKKFLPIMEKVEVYFKENTGWEMTMIENFYLILHLCRLEMINKNK